MYQPDFAVAIQNEPVPRTHFMKFLKILKDHGAHDIFATIYENVVRVDYKCATGDSYRCISEATCVLGKANGYHDEPELPDWKTKEFWFLLLDCCLNPNPTPWWRKTGQYVGYQAY